MKKELITSTEHTLGGSPRLDGRRLDVGHVIWGVTEYESTQSYQNDFGVTVDQVRHAIMYCKDEICEFKVVPQSCANCSKRFRKDAKTWEEYLLEMDEIEAIGTDDDPISKLGNGSFFLGDSDELKKSFEGENTWETAQELHLKLESQLNLPTSYELITQEIG